MTIEIPKYPVFVMCGRDPRRRRLLEAVDPEGKYKSKALLPFLGKRLIDWQLEELIKSPFIDGLYLLGLCEEDASFDFNVDYIPMESTTDFGDKLAIGIEYLESQGHHPDLVVISSCDAPGIRVDEINAFFEKIQEDPGGDAYISLVPEAVAEAVFPHSGRVVAHFRDCDVFPGELYALSPRVIRDLQRVIGELSLRRRQINRQSRKISMGPMLSYIGKRPRTWTLIIKYLMGLASLHDGESALSASFGVKVRGVIIPEAGFGMDMDLPEDYERLKAYITQTKMIQ